MIRKKKICRLQKKNYQQAKEVSNIFIPQPCIIGPSLYTRFQIKFISLGFNSCHSLAIQGTSLKH